MGRYKQPYTLWKRKLSHGLSVYYYRYYLPDGTRSGYHSTGCTTKGKAVAYVEQLRKEERMGMPDSPTFDVYFEGWWGDNCPYVARKKTRGKDLSPTFIDARKSWTKRYISPAFGSTPLDAIRPAQIEDFLTSLTDEHNLAHGTANHVFKTMRLMLDEAVRLGDLTKNPCQVVDQLHQSAKEQPIFSRAELTKLLNASRWTDRIAWAATVLAAFTGARQGEILGARVEDFSDNVWHIQRGWRRKHGEGTTKTGKDRFVPLVAEARKAVNERIAAVGSGYLMSELGTKPVPPNRINAGLYAAMEAAKVPRKERHFHSLRHTFNSLLANQLDPAQIRRLTGHATESMREHYTHNDAAQILKSVEEALKP